MEAQDETETSTGNEWQNLFHPDPVVSAAVSRVVEAIEQAKAELPQGKSADLLDTLQDYLMNQWDESEGAGTESGEEALAETA